MSFALIKVYGLQGGKISPGQYTDYPTYTQTSFLLIRLCQRTGYHVTKWLIDFRLWGLCETGTFLYRSCYICFFHLHSLAQWLFFSPLFFQYEIFGKPLIFRVYSHWYAKCYSSVREFYVVFLCLKEVSSGGLSLTIFSRHG